MVLKQTRLASLWHFKCFCYNYKYMMDTCTPKMIRSSVADYWCFSSTTIFLIFWWIIISNSKCHLEDITLSITARIFELLKNGTSGISKPNVNVVHFREKMSPSFMTRRSSRMMMAEMQYVLVSMRNDHKRTKTMVSK